MGIRIKHKSNVLHRPSDFTWSHGFVRLAVPCLILALAAGCASQPQFQRKFPPKSSAPQARFKTAENLSRNGNDSQAWTLIGPIDITSLPKKDRLHAALFKAQLAMRVHRPRSALITLSELSVSQPPKVRLEVLKLKGQSEFEIGRITSGLKLLVRRGRLVQSNAKILKNDRLIWLALKNAASLPSPDGLSVTAQGWLALARLSRAAWVSPKAFNQRLTSWEKTYPNHPATAGLIAQIRAAIKARMSYPSCVAIDLPLSGPYSQEARAVEAGLLAAYYQDSTPRPTLRIYNTRGTYEGGQSTFGEIQKSKCHFIVGPLTRQGVRAAAENADPSIPTLALNYLSKGATVPSRWYQFGLSPEAEARAVARRLISRGLMRGVVLSSDTKLGLALQQAFSKTFQDLGGIVLKTAHYRPRAEHFSRQLSNLFGLVASREREINLSELLGVSLGFSARRRQDIQFVFITSSFSEARLIVPQVQYFQGIGLPVFALSGVYRPGSTHPDLAGVSFPIMPWFISSSKAIKTLRVSFSKLFPNEWETSARLYALGYDAWRLIPLLANYKKPLSTPVRGMTGILKLGHNQTVERRLAWAAYGPNGTMHPILEEKVE